MPENLRKTKLGGHDVTVADRVLIATAEAAHWTTEQVPYGEIVVRAWRAFPEQFGLPGHPEHPDSSDVHKRLYGPLKSGEFIESLGNKTFRVTERGLIEARAAMARLPESLPSRPTIKIDVRQGEATQSVIAALLDAASPCAGTVAVQLLAVVLTTIYPGLEVQETDDHLVVGDTTFTVLIPASLEKMQSWRWVEEHGTRPRLLVRDSVLPEARCNLDGLARPEKAVLGIESFIAQMIENLGVYDEPGILQSLKSLIWRYNRELSGLSPRIHLAFASKED